MTRWLLPLLLLAACDDQGSVHTTPSGAGVETAPRPPAPPSNAPRPDETETPPTTIVHDGPDDLEDIADHSEEHAGKCAPVDPDLKPMQVLRFKFTSKVKNREGVDKLSVLRPGQRVYAHLTMRNRSGYDRCLHLTFRVNGKQRTALTLGIGKSWSWRTWAFNTVRDDERGFLELEVKDDQGKLVLRERLAIVPDPGR